jgi:hypothetical protein
MTSPKPVLPDGLVIVVKQECETCRMVVPVLERLAATTTVTVYTQDDPAFPAHPRAIHDEDLGISWHHEIETVPTLIRVEYGAEVERTVGWLAAEWERVSGVSGLGDGLPVMRPGCGSLSVDPDLVDELRARHGGSVLRSRRIDVADAEDEFELMFNRGWTDGLPVVPPTEQRVLAMLEGTTRAPGEIVATVPPDLVDVTVEKVAIAAVMAGCKPEYLPWVLTAVEAVCNDDFNMHGVLATTMPVGPVLVCSGPGTRAIGGGRPGEVDRATHGNPGKLSFCFAEHVDSPIGHLSQQLGVEPGTDAVTVFAGEGPRCIVDQMSRAPESLIRSLAAAVRAMHHPKLVLAFDAMLVLSPEHLRVFTDAGWDRDRIVWELHLQLTTPIAELERGAGGIAEGVPPGLGAAELPKLRPDGLLLAYAGGGAGLFSTLIGGWANGATGSKPVARTVRY